MCVTVTCIRLLDVRKEPCQLVPTAKRYRNRSAAGDPFYPTPSDQAFGESGTHLAPQMRMKVCPINGPPSEPLRSLQGIDIYTEIAEKTLTACREPTVGCVADHDISIEEKTCDLDGPPASKVIVTVSRFNESL